MNRQDLLLFLALFIFAVFSYFGNSINTSLHVLTIEEAKNVDTGRFMVNGFLASIIETKNSYIFFISDGNTYLKAFAKKDFLPLVEKGRFYQFVIDATIYKGRKYFFVRGIS